MEQLVQRLYESVFGNGRPGIDETVRRHDQLLDEMKVDEISDKVKAMWSWMREQKEKDRMRTWALYSAAFGSVGSLCVTIVLLVMKGV